MDGITVLSPIGVNMTEAQAIAARLPDLNDKTVGLVNNNKPNSHLLQELIPAILAAVIFQVRGLAIARDLLLRGLVLRRQIDRPGDEP